MPANIIEDRYMSKNEYRELCRIYYTVNSEYDPVRVNQFNEKLVAQLVHKNFLVYSDNTNKVQLSVTGFNSIGHPPGLAYDQFNPILTEEFNNWCKKNNHLILKRRKTHIAPIELRERKSSTPRGNTRSTTGVKKIDYVKKYLDKGQTPEQILNSMIKEGVTSTLSSVHSFIRTIKLSKS